MTKDFKRVAAAVRLANLFADCPEASKEIVAEAQATGDMREVESLLAVFSVANRLTRQMAQAAAEQIAPRQLRSDFGGEHASPAEAACATPAE